ncbi:hypothetical protein BJ508DRAFT_303927 [Ascobolus immersus RN42]|uniref:Uncharacterized protein n=1 Tax=Ascobolus immersus RN42 TaxID=1160509 RepID=A0A3N4IEA6_ASCIM|nr:hypothetical protein BJ508DRAFT_303927 [Ascobolus immersus RN42]
MNNSDSIPRPLSPATLLSLGMAVTSISNNPTSSWIEIESASILNSTHTPHTPLRYNRPGAQAPVFIPSPTYAPHPTLETDSSPPRVLERHPEPLKIFTRRRLEQVPQAPTESEHSPPTTPQRYYYAPDEVDGARTTAEYLMSNNFLICPFCFHKRIGFCDSHSGVTIHGHGNSPWNLVQRFFHCINCKKGPITVEQLQLVNADEFARAEKGRKELGEMWPGHAWEKHMSTSWRGRESVAKAWWPGDDSDVGSYNDQMYNLSHSTCEVCSAVQIVIPEAPPRYYQPPPEEDYVPPAKLTSEAQQIVDLQAKVDRLLIKNNKLKEKMENRIRKLLEENIDYEDRLSELVEENLVLRQLNEELLGQQHPLEYE